jgi:hypothetical protein
VIFKGIRQANLKMKRREDDDMKQDILIMKNGKMMMKRGSRIRPMKEDIALFDGMRVMMDGTVIMTDGIARTMMEGDAITMDGRMTDMEKMEARETKDDPS